MKNDTDTAPAGAVHWRCKVTAAGAAKQYGASKHKKGRGALVVLTEAEAAAAEKQGWVTREGLVEAPEPTAAPSATAEAGANA